MISEVQVTVMEHGHINFRPATQIGAGRNRGKSIFNRGNFKTTRPGHRTRSLSLGVLLGSPST